MIKNFYLFFVALLFVATAVLIRHVERFPFAAPLANFADARLFVLIGGFFLVLAMIPFARGKRTTPAIRAVFEKESMDNLPGKILALTSVPVPDIRLIVDYVIFQAISAEASDIHFDPGRGGMEIKYRLDGLIAPITVVPKGLETSITDRLKVLSNLILYKDSTPQDGRLGGNGHKARASDELSRSGLGRADFRIAFMPTLHGERIVIRILGQETSQFNFAELGMEEPERKILNRLIEQPQGMIVLTGPTGSGKSTTICAALQAILRTSHNKRSIATLEDPIEFDMPGINQSQVDDSRNFTFNSGLRAILRQDPDVIMVGEIRDRETAEIAIQAGMTGHLLITTVHANSAASAFSRLLEMGIPAYSLNSAVTAIVAQRLTRKLCPTCRQEHPPTEKDLQDLGISAAAAPAKVFSAKGCSECADTGYKGRTAIYEVLEVTESIRRIITREAETHDIVAAARQSGMRTLWDAGIYAIETGMTSPEEIGRVLFRETR